MVFKVQDLDFKVAGKKILENINLQFEQAKFNAIIGPNGCGKSTLIKLFAQINKQSSGKILYLNTELEKIKRKDFAKQVAFFFQFNSVADVTVKQMVAFGRSAHKSLYQNLNPTDYKIIGQAIEKCELQALVECNMSSLSGGEKQRVYLAMCLAQEPEVIILDEPTNHLDIKYQFQLLSLLKDVVINNQITVICILHDLNQVLKYADNTVILKAGTVISCGKTTEVINSQVVKQVFDVESIIHNDGNGLHIDYIV